MHISFKIIKFYFTLCCSTCFGHHCVHHQELLIAAHAVSGHRVVLGRLFPPALFCCYCCFRVRKQPTQHHTVTRNCMCSNKKLLMMDTMVSETRRAAQSEIKFYDFKTDVHLVGFYSILLHVIGVNENVKNQISYLSN
jgi:hypothetical protein